jgi:hypothetical protein
MIRPPNPTRFTACGGIGGQRPPACSPAPTEAGSFPHVNPDRGRLKDSPTRPDGGRRSTRRASVCPPCPRPREGFCSDRRELRTVSQLRSSGNERASWLRPICTSRNNPGFLPGTLQLGARIKAPDEGIRFRVPQRPVPFAEHQFPMPLKAFASPCTGTVRATPNRWRKFATRGAVDAECGHLGITGTARPARDPSVCPLPGGRWTCGAFCASPSSCGRGSR